jgi:two-component system, chemotaxis family, chemotaxis protein CheY
MFGARRSGSAARSDEVEAGAVKTVLVADDQADLRRIVRLLLTRGTGWEVVEAADGDEAVTVASEHALDAAVLDHRMPGRTGVEVARHLRDSGFTGPLIIFSAYLEADVLAEAERLEVTTVAKGDIAELSDVLHGALGDG